MRAFAFVVVALTLLGCFEAKEDPFLPEDSFWSIEDLMSAAIVGENQVFLVSTAGAIYRSLDGAKRFRRVYSEPGVSLFDVGFLDSETGWVVGEGRLLATTDGGKTWQEETLPADFLSAELRFIEIVDSEHVLIGSGSGLVLWTTNGGRSWERSVYPETVKFTALSCKSRKPIQDASGSDSIEPSNCLAAIAAGGLLRTRDGGIDWQGVQFQSPFPSAALTFDEGEVELSSERRAELGELVQRWNARGAVGVRLDPRVSQAELDGIADQVDPEALFEIVEARLLEVRNVFEEAGMPAASIEVPGEPPWGFADYLDDDPEFLNRYWQPRLSETAGVEIEAIERGILTSIDADAGIGFGDSGLVFERLSEGKGWTARGKLAGEGKMVSFARGRGQWWGTTDSGRIVHWATLPELLSATENSNSPRADRRARRMVFSPDERWGLIVGDQGHVVRLAGDAGDWKPLPLVPEKGAAPQ